jgi:hypothetical protein
MTLAKTVTSSQFQYVQEWDDDFLSLFPHRHDYIWAEHTTPKDKVAWKTESRHPLSDRLIRQGAYLYGVRFGSTTSYCLIDIDAGSAYHPSQDPLAITRLINTLEPLGLVAPVACTSSYSRGIHLYFPFQEAQKTWELSVALQAVLESAGFKPALGQLELFPNVRLFIAGGSPSLYAAHRLPMQVGSYLLNKDYDPITSDQATFVQHWRFAQRRNDLSNAALQQVLKTVKRSHYGISGKAEKFLNDLNADIEPGWSAHGQTNRLLGRIALRSYIFGHLLYGCEPLEQKALVNKIVEVATQLPGYQEWCRHQHEIEHRAEEWAACVQTSRYFHFGQGQANKNPLTPTQDGRATWNQQQKQGARERIQAAIAELLNQGKLPANATARFHTLTQYGIGGGSLYRHRDLWHPSFINAVENPPDPPTFHESAPSAENGMATPQSLLAGNDGNALSELGLSDFDAADSGTEAQAMMAEVKAQLQATHEARRQAAAQRAAIEQQRGQARVIARMQAFLASKDPILIAEALAWAEINPGLLQMKTNPTDSA